MAQTWTPEQAASLAPDAASLKAAQGLAAPRKWSGLGSDDQFVWGLAQGSGAQPYQSQVELNEPAFKCSCPSRKFPCKHGLGLLLLFAAQPALCPKSARPAWVEEWAVKRTERAVKVVAKAENPPAPVDPAAQAKRKEKREANIQQGVVFLEGWLRDLVRQGFGNVNAGYEFWDNAARRLVDAQAPGLARRVRALGSILGESDGAETRMLAELGRLHLLLAAYSRRSELSLEWQAEVLTQVGWTVDQEDLRQKEGIDRTWFVGAQTVREEERLITRTSYLFSHDGEPAKLLEFSHASQASVATLALGRSVRGELVFFPGVAPLRAMLKAVKAEAAAPQRSKPLEHCTSVLELHGKRLALNPLADETPFLVRLTPERVGERWALRDGENATLPVARSFVQGWELQACAGGHPLEICGSWDGNEFTPLSALAGDTVLNFSETSA